ncbi:MAG: ABC transporter substrate-binding protein [Anaerolineae bacterium]
MIRRIRWQAVTAVLGAALLLGVMTYLAYTTTTVVVPEEGGTYVEGVAGRPSHINPLLSGFNRVDSDLVALVFSGLTKVDEGGRVEPDLAIEWDVSDGGSSYRFRLREDVVWHDGTSFSAHDVVFTIQAIQDPDFQGPPELAVFWQAVQVEAPDETTVLFTLPDPFAPFLTYTDLPLLPRHLLERVPARDLARNAFNARPVGTGPFVVREVSARAATLERNPRYYGEQSRLDQLEFRFFPDYASVLDAYLEGEVDGIGGVAPRELEALRGIETLSIYSAPMAGYELIFLNLSHPVLGQGAVRRAMHLSLDRQGLIDGILGGQGLPAYSPILPQSWAYSREATFLPEDPQAAESILEEEGWADGDGDGVREKEGVALAFTLTTDQDPYRQQISQEIARQLEPLGFRIRIRTLPAADLVRNALRPGSFDALVFRWARLPADPDPYEMWHSSQIPDQGQNFGGFGNRDVDEILEQARMTVDLARRRELYVRFQELFAQEVPAIPLYYPIYSYAVDQRVGGIQLGPVRDPSDRFATISEWFVNIRRVTVSESEG